MSVLRSGVRAGGCWATEYREWADLETALAFVSTRRAHTDEAPHYYPGGRYVIEQDGVVLWSERKR